MKFLCIVLIAILLSIGMVAAVQYGTDDNQILGYARGIIESSNNHNAVAVINGTDLSVGIMVDPRDEGVGTSVEGLITATTACNLCLLADQIAQAYPGRFTRVMGLVMNKYNGSKPLAGCGIYF